MPLYNLLHRGIKQITIFFLNTHIPKPSVHRPTSVRTPPMAPSIEYHLPHKFLTAQACSSLKTTALRTPPFSIATSNSHAEPFWGPMKRASSFFVWSTKENMFE